MHAPSHRSSFPDGTARVRYLWPLHRFACFCAGAVLFLICVGGMVTSKEAGMSVPDWPNTYGYNMFFFPWQDWVGGVFFEHSHRLVASGLGTLACVLAVALCFQPRIWLRWVGAAAVGLVVCEGIIGGLRVVWRQADFGIVHGCLAQGIFILVSLIALFTSRWWLAGRSDLVPRKWPALTLAVTILIFCQLMLGATMRHQHEGLAISDFPAAYGQAWPKTDPASIQAYNLERLHHNQTPTSAVLIDLQMAHRVGAMLVTLAILAATVTMWMKPGSAAILRGWSAVWVGLVFVQVALGIFTIWTNKAADVATAHVAVGALTLVLGALLTAMSARLVHGAQVPARSVA